MAAFAGPGKTTILVRNHELTSGDGGGPPVVGTNPYDLGRLRVARPRSWSDRIARSLDAYVTNAGTQTNCAGGATGTWLTCEEDRTTSHGYC
jgi:uncharacterized protein